MLDGEQTVDDGIVEDIAGTPSFQASPGEVDPFQKVEPHARPDNIPEKFWDADKGVLNTDALLKSYSELEKQFSLKGEEEEPGGEPKPEGEEKLTGEETPEGEEKPKEEEEEQPAPSDLTAAVEAAQVAYAESGTLSAELRAPFLAAGISDAQIDLYLAGVKAQEEGIKQAAVKAAGVDSYEEVQAAVAWAAENWTPKKIEAFNAQASDVETVGLAVTALFKDYRDANPGEGRLTNVGGGTNRGDVYTSKDQYAVDLNKADALADPQERRLARRAAVAKMERSIKAKSLR